MSARGGSQLRKLVRLPEGLPWSPPDWPGGAERPPLERRTGVDYDTDWSRRYPARLARAVVLDNLTRPAMHAVAAPSVTGLELLSDLEGPVIFAANHASHLDTPLLLVCLPQRFRHRSVVGAAADHFFDRRWKAALWALAVAAVPVERQRVSRRSADLAAQLLSEGWNLLLFPEGGRTPDGWGQPFKGGAAYLAKRTGAPVVPTHISGTRHILGKGSRALRPSRTGVRFGSPLRPADAADARDLSDKIEKAVAALADESGTDWWSARKRASSGTTPPLQGPDAAAWRRAWALEQTGPTPEPSWPREGRRRSFREPQELGRRRANR